MSIACCSVTCCGTPATGRVWTALAGSCGTFCAAAGSADALASASIAASAASFSLIALLSTPRSRNRNQTAVLQRIRTRRDDERSLAHARADHFAEGVGLQSDLHGHFNRFVIAVDDENVRALIRLRNRLTRHDDGIVVPGLFN